MTQTKRHRSPALQSLHEAMEDLHEVGAIDKATMRDFDVRCLTAVENSRLKRSNTSARRLT